MEVKTKVPILTQKQTAKEIRFSILKLKNTGFIYRWRILIIERNPKPRTTKHLLRRLLKGMI